jgi:hypothetical protein
MSPASVNKIYSILLRGSASSSSWYRRALSAGYKPSGRRQAEADLLRGGSVDPAYWSFVADTLIATALASTMRYDLLEYDQVNTYLLEAVTPGTMSLVIGTPTDSGYQFDEDASSRLWVSLTARVLVDAGMGQADVGGTVYPYTVSGGLSNPIPLGPGVNLRLRDVTSGSHTIDVRLTRPPRLNLAALKDKLEQQGLPWSPKYAALRTTGDIGEWLGAFLLDYCATEGGA